MKSLTLLSMAVARLLAIVVYTLVKVVIVFHWTTMRDIGMALAEEWRVAADADSDDWQR